MHPWELDVRRLQPFFLTTAIILGPSGLTACVKSNLSGEADKNKARSDAEGGDFGDAMLDASDAGSAGDVNDAVVDCATGAVMKPAETYTFTTNTEIRASVNSHCDVGIPTAWATEGAVRADQATLDKVCRLKGFAEANGFEAKQWNSPDDDLLAWWDEASSSFMVKGAGPGNDYITKLTCQGWVHESCSEELNKEKCQYN